jgi:hypothetical protein
MYELMFRHDLLESGRLGLREVSLPLFRTATELIAAAVPGTGAALDAHLGTAGRSCPGQGA